MDRRMRWTMAALLLAAVAVVLPASGARAGEEGIPVPQAAGLSLDGSLAEPAWATASPVEVAGLEVPVPGSDQGTLLLPEVRVLASGGALWIGVRVAEPPGPGMGVALLLGPGDLVHAAEAVALSYLPQSPGLARFQVRGPRGAGRAVYRVEGAAQLEDPAAWSLEIRLPFEDLRLADAVTPLRLAVAVHTRDPSLLAWAPPGSAFSGPGDWARLEAPADGGWPLALPAPPDAAALGEADRSDEERLAAWRAFLAADQRSVDGLLDAAGLLPPASEAAARADALDAALRRPDVVRGAAEASLLAPLDRILALRPDLAMALVLKGEVLLRLGADAEAAAAFDAALAKVPGLREARFGRWFELAGPAFARGTPGGPTVWEDAFRRVQDAEVPDDPFAHDGLSFGRGLLGYFHGDFDEAVRLLEPLAARYPFAAATVFAAERAGRARREWPREQQRRAAEARKDDLPRIRLRTARGEVVVELFEDEARNAVHHLVWLVRHGFYDDTVFDRAVPFLGTMGGAPPPGAPGEGPGYEVASESPEPPSARSLDEEDSRRRRLFRGTLTLVSPAPDGLGARFLLTTGTALHLDEEHPALGRVVEGQEVVDALVAGDRLLAAEVLRTRPGVEYRPLTVEGGPAPEPRR